MIDRLEQSLSEAMSFAGVREFPELAKEGQVWAKALVLVRKNTGTRNWAVAKKRAMGISLIADFGESGIVAEYQEIRPYLIAENLAATMKSKAAKMDLLINYYGESVRESAERMTVEHLNEFINAISINKAIEIEERRLRDEKAARTFWEATENGEIIDDGVKAYTEKEMPKDEF